MSTFEELEDQLREGLKKLHADVSEARQQKKDRDVIQRTMDRTLGEWSMKLTEEQDEHIKESRRSAELAHPEVAKDAGIEQEKERAMLVLADHGDNVSAIRDRISELRSGLIYGICDISDGRAPNLEFAHSRSGKELQVRPVKNIEFSPEQMTPEKLKQFFAERAKGQTPESKPAPNDDNEP